MTVNLIGQTEHKRMRDLYFHNHRTNTGELERVLSGLFGTMSLIGGLSRRNWIGAALTMAGGALLHRAVSGYCPAFGTLGIDRSNSRLRRSTDTYRLNQNKVQPNRATKVRQSIAINRSPSELYRVWRTVDRLPSIMNHLDSVRVMNDRLSHWVIKTMPGIPPMEWDAEIIHDVENQRIGWKSLPGADITNAGSVEFKPTGDGQQTWLTVTLQYEPPGGQLRTAMAKLFGEDPNMKIGRDLQRFKELMETEAFSQAGGEGKR